MTTFVHQPLTLWATGDQIEVHAGFLAYGKDAPDAVEIVLPRHDGSDTIVSFMVDRVLLAGGLERPVTSGEITVQPHTRADWLTITLPIDGQARAFYADSVALRTFLNATAELVPLKVAA